jgi:hypothetical protein
MNWGTCFGDLKIDYENSLFRLAYNPPFDLNALSFWVKLCLCCHIIKILFWSHHIYQLNGGLVIASNEIIFGGDFNFFFGNMCCSMKKLFQQRNPHICKIFCLEKETMNLRGD